MRDYMKTVFAGALALTLAVSGGCTMKKEALNQEEGKTSLTYWVEFSNQVAAGVQSFNELPVYKKILADLNLDVKFTHPVNGQVKEQLNLLLASRELPDIIQYQFSSDYPGGAQKAMDDGCIIPIDIKKYAPNLLAYLTQNPNIDRMVKTDKGEYYCFPSIYGDETLLTYTGIIIRQDYLDRVNLERPETIDEWHAVLTAFKNELGLKSPFTASFGDLSYFAAAFGVRPGLHLDNGRVKFGQIEAGYKDFIETMARWYKEGLFDNNIASLDGKIKKQNVLSGDTGAAVGNTGGGIGTWMNSLKDTPGADLRPAKNPVKNKGEKPMWGHRINEYSPFGSASITPQCKDVEAAARLLDYGYSEEGQLAFNFGVLEESYIMVDGYPTYTELVTSNPNGKSMGDMIGFYACPNGAAPTVKDKRYMEQFSPLPAQKESLVMWADTDAKDNLLPPVTLAAEESTEAANIKNELETYMSAAFLKIITGVEDISGYNSCIDDIQTLGAQRYIDIYQAAYERYMGR